MNKTGNPPVDNAVSVEMNKQKLWEMQDALSHAVISSIEDVYQSVVLLNQLARELYPPGIELAKALITNYESGILALLQSSAYNPKRKKDELIFSHLSCVLARTEVWLFMLTDPMARKVVPETSSDVVSIQFVGFTTNLKASS